MKSIVEVIPNARRTFAALRDIGYSFNSAVADLVDNSIAADARKVTITFKREGGTVWLSIADNGNGMDDETLLEAVRLGSESEYEANSLGKYGMGLKTASLSQTKCLCIASRPKGGRKVSAFELNLDHIEATNKWELFRWGKEQIDGDDDFSFLRSKSGTCVVWKELDGYTSRGAADNFFGRLLRGLKLHLRMTFHRFLDGSAEAGKITIGFNGPESLTPWDPMCRQERNTTELRSHELTLLEGRGDAIVTIDPYVLPTKDGDGGFSSLEAWEDARGLLSWNDSQGCYVYRNDRLIHVGGWLRTRAKDEHSKYARVAINFNTDSDELFSLSVNKSQIRLPASLFDYLKHHVNPEVVRAAQKPYRASTKRGQTGSRHAKINRNIVKTAPTIMERHGVTVGPNEEGSVQVSNPRGGFVANSVREATRYKLRHKFSVQAGVVEDGRLWKLVCKPDGGFLVVLNCEHPFYKTAYERDGTTRALTNFVDALLFAMAYVELRTANTTSRPMFDEIRDTISEVLREIYWEGEEEDH